MALIRKHFARNGFRRSVTVTIVGVVAMTIGSGVAPAEPPAPAGTVVMDTQNLSWGCVFRDYSSAGCDWLPRSVADVNGDGNQDMIWRQRGSGTVSGWLLSGNGTVLGTQELATAAPGQTNVDIADLNGDGHPDMVTTPGDTTDTIRLLDGTGQTIATQTVQSGCSGIDCLLVSSGLADMNGDGHPDITTLNRSSGVVTTALLDGAGSGIGMQSLSWTCGTADGCSSQWTPVGLGDLNGDGHPDLVWQNECTGEVSTWLIGAGGVVTGSRDVNWNSGGGCSNRDWYAVGIADMNGDGEPDIVWANGTTGQVSSWLLDPPCTGYNCQVQFWG
jgi:hypothetical protein